MSRSYIIHRSMPVRVCVCVLLTNPNKRHRPTYLGIENHFLKSSEREPSYDDPPNCS